MAYHITQIINNSSKSVVLTNPVTERDAHLLPKNSSLNPEHPPLVQHISDVRPTGEKGELGVFSSVPYELAATKTLNVYTMKNNWCFWDNGSSALVGVGEGEESDTHFLTHPATNLRLTIDGKGTPSFAPV